MSCAAPSRFSVSSKMRALGCRQVPHHTPKARAASRSTSRCVLVRYSQASPTWLLPTALPASALAEDGSESRALGGKPPHPAKTISAKPASSFDIPLLATVILQVLIVSPHRSVEVFGADVEQVDRRVGELLLRQDAEIGHRRGLGGYDRRQHGTGDRSDGAVVEAKVVLAPAALADGLRRRRSGDAGDIAEQLRRPAGAEHREAARVD